tara:strand:+ start:731 stop:922 length:192 start_codon:yes stop_codon:yes gene_type:complete
MTNHISDHLSDSAKYVVDVVSVFTVLGTLVDFLPAVAAAFTIIWTGIRIWETDTVKNFVKKWK